MVSTKELESELLLPSTVFTDPGGVKEDEDRNACPGAMASDKNRIDLIIVVRVMSSVGSTVSCVI